MSFRRSAFISAIAIGLLILFVGVLAVGSIEKGDSPTTFRSGNTLIPASSMPVVVDDKADKSGFSDVLVWRFCSSFIQGNVESEQIGFVVGLEESALIKDNAKRVRRLVVESYEIYPKVDAGLIEDTYDACEKWRDDDWAGR